MIQNLQGNEDKFSGQRVPKNCGGTKRLEDAPAF